MLKMGHKYKSFPQPQFGTQEVRAMEPISAELKLAASSYQLPMNQASLQHETLAVRQALPKRSGKQKTFRSLALECRRLLTVSASRLPDCGSNAGKTFFSRAFQWTACAQAAAACASTWAVNASGCDTGVDIGRPSPTFPTAPAPTIELSFLSSSPCPCGYPSTTPAASSTYSSSPVKSWG